MSFRPELPSGLNLTRRTTTPVKLPKMTFPMIGGLPESGGQAAGPPPPAYQTLADAKYPLGEEERSTMEESRSSRNTQTEVAPVLRENSRVIVYGRSGCEECMAAVADLIQRQVCFIYRDVNRDEKALQHLQAICGDAPVVPVIVQIGSGAS